MNGILETAKEWCHVRMLDSAKPLLWTKTPCDWFKLNVDGVRNGNCHTGAGSVICDTDGIWVSYFSANKGNDSFLESKIWGLLLGLKLAVSNHLEPLMWKVILLFWWK